MLVLMIESCTLQLLSVPGTHKHIIFILFPETRVALCIPIGCTVCVYGLRCVWVALCIGCTVYGLHCVWVALCMGYTVCVYGLHCAYTCMYYSLLLLSVPPSTMLTLISMLVHSALLSVVDSVYLTVLILCRTECTM